MPYTDQYKSEAATFASLTLEQQEASRNEQVRLWLKSNSGWALTQRFAALIVSPTWAEAYGPPEALQAAYEELLHKANIDKSTLPYSLDPHTGYGIDDD